MSDQSIVLRIEGVSAELLPERAEIDERICRATLARAMIPGFSGALGEVLPEDVIGRPATLTLRFHDVTRTFALLIEAIEDHGGHAWVTLASAVNRLDDTSDYRVFVDRSATEIAALVLGEHGLRLDVRAQRDDPRRPHCVQVFESDLAFCARLLAEEGMSFFPQDDDPSLLHVVDAPGTFPDTGASIPFIEDAGLLADRALVTARLHRRVTVEQASLRDYDFTRPLLDLQGDAGTGSLSWHEYPGGFRTNDAGRELAAIRLAEHKALAKVLDGEATEPLLTAGGVFEVRDAAEVLEDDRWLLLSVVHEAMASGEASEIPYRARIRAVPADKGYRPPRPTPKPRGGVETADVTGSPGREIHVDAFGRAHVRMRWDRRSPRDDRSSGDARVLEPQLSGALLNPRVGWDELCGFSDRGGEIPILLGRVYNTKHAPPANLPARKVETHIGTRTTPGGEGRNVIKIDDGAGQEDLSIKASGAYKERTENDKRTSIGEDDVTEVGGRRNLIVHERFAESVGGERAIDVSGLRKVTVDTNYGLKASAETVVVDGARVIRAGGDYLTRTSHFVRMVGGTKQELGIEHQSVFARGASTLIVGGSMTTDAGPSASVSVAGAGIIKVSGAQTVNAGTYSLTVRGLYAEAFGARSATSRLRVSERFGKVTYDVGGAAVIGGAEVAVSAATKLTIKADGITITMTPASITIAGDFDGGTPSVEDGVHRYG